MSSFFGHERTTKAFLITAHTDVILYAKKLLQKGIFRGSVIASLQTLNFTVIWSNQVVALDDFNFTKKFKLASELASNVRRRLSRTIKSTL